MIENCYYCDNCNGMMYMKWYGSDEYIGGGMTKATNLEDIQGLGGPMTRAKAKKKAKEALNLLVTLTQAQVRRKKRPK